MIQIQPISAQEGPAKYRAFFIDMRDKYGLHPHKANTIGITFCKDQVPALEQYIRDQTELADNVADRRNAIAQDNIVAARYLIKEIERWRLVELSWKE